MDWNVGMSNDKTMVALAKDNETISACAVSGKSG